MHTSSNKPPPQRLALVDRVRGGAVVLMVIYHFGFDLDQSGWIHQSFNSDLRWLSFRALIVSLFMAALGASTVLAWPGAVDRARLLRRQLRLGAAALLVTVGSALMFPASFIWFGILHFAWLASLLALPLRRAGWLLPVAAVAVAWAGNTLSAPVFDTPWLGWIGFMTHKPLTEDYVPLFPWFAAVLAGLWLGQRLPAGTPRPAPAPGAALPATGQRGTAAAASGAAATADRLLRWTGAHTLLIYLLHQPVLIGALDLLRIAGVRPGPG